MVENTDRLTEVLEFYISCYEKEINQVWTAKLGLDKFQEDDSELITELNELLQKVETDMTILFRELCNISEPDVENLSYAFYDTESIPVEEWNSWLTKWWSRVDGEPDQKLMLATNPKYVLRNWMAQLAIDAAEEGDFSVCEELHKVLKNPYFEQSKFENKWYQKRPDWAKNRVGCSMLSCSS